MPARAHRRAPDPLAGAVNPLPPMQGALSNGPPGGGLALPREGGPLRPPTPSRSANWRICKIAISSAPSRPRLPKPREGAPAPCVHPAPRASRSAARFARRLRLHLTPSTSPAGAASSPRRANWRPHAPPFPGPRSPAGRPSPRGWGGGPPVAHGYVGTGVPGVVPRGSPCQGPHRNIPRHPGTPTQRDAATLAGPHSLSPGPLGPGRFYTDSPTPFGV
ncbi:hypothetical protein N7534_012143 [Penicillium rubens]|nr:hypothetical protein N7534_012143 [Penicillium rubens]